MSSINTITVSGNLGKDPELKEFQSGTKKCTFSIAVSEAVKVNNQWETKTTWVLAEFWGHDADFISKYAQKGSFIVVSGRLSEDTWEKDGETKRKMFIKGSSFQLPKTNSEKIVNAPVDSNSRNTRYESQNVVDFPKKEDDFNENIPF